METETTTELAVIEPVEIMPIDAAAELTPTGETYEGTLAVPDYSMTPAESRAVEALVAEQAGHLPVEHVTEGDLTDSTELAEAPPEAELAAAEPTAWLDAEREEVTDSSEPPLMGTEQPTAEPPVKPKAPASAAIPNAGYTPATPQPVSVSRQRGQRIASAAREVGEGCIYFIAEHMHIHMPGSRGVSLSGGGHAPPSRWKRLLAWLCRSPLRAETAWFDWQDGMKPADAGSQMHHRNARRRQRAARRLGRHSAEGSRS